LKFKKGSDLPVVRPTGGNIEGALKILRKRIENYKTFKILKIRRLNPAPAARKRYKRHAARRRRKWKVF